MASFDKSTPWPPPRHSIGTSPSALMPPITELSIDFPRPAQNLLDVKPRRPKNPRGSLGWDPTIDIYEDTTALPGLATASQELQTKLPARLRAHHNGTASLARAPQRFSVGLTDVHGANIKKRRTSSVAQPSQEADRSADEVKPSAISKDARRRTIYVPSEDTTIFTIHPGAPSQNRITLPRRPGRSDVFLDLVALTKTSSVPTDSSQRTIQSPKKPLETTPRRRPLHQCVRQLQGSAFPEDILGSGGGKENIPPGMLWSMKKSEKSLMVPSVKLAPEPCPSINAQSVKSPDLRVRSNILLGNTPLIRSGGTQQRISCVTELKSSQISPRRSPKPVVRIVGTGLQGTPRRNQPALISWPAPSLYQKENTPARLKVPLLAPKVIQQYKQYTILSEDVAKPELYEENWLSQQEETIKQLMNNLYQSTSNEFADFSTPDCSLRQQLIHIYNNSSIVLLHKRLEASLRFGALSISKDTLSRVGRVKDDLGQRQRFLDLWLKTYDLPMLQAAAETVTGRAILQASQSSVSPRTKANQSPHHYIRQIERFLLAFLVRNEDAIRNSQSSAGSPVNPKTDPGGHDDVGSTAWAWRRTTIRSLMLILLIDKAAAAGQFKQCIFQASSPYKSSVAVLQALSGLLLPSIGDVSRVLGHMSYQIGHVQYPLQEYSYHINNLATDLRDGVLVTRLVEILLYPSATLVLQNHDVTVTLPCGDILLSTPQCDPGQNWVLSQHLKHPCTSRVQKLYNVQIALSALAGVKDVKSMLDGIEANDIVDGHREKTVSFLWSILGRLGLGTLLDFKLLEMEIVRLQKAWLTRASSKLGEQLENQNEDEDAELRYLEGLQLQTRLLYVWARHVARLHGVTVSNLSTSFADGAAFRAIVEEYSGHLISTSLVTTTIPTTDTSSQIISSQDARQAPFITTLRSLGCSHAFIKLFQNTQSITSLQVTTALLAFLASRFLPASRPHFAAIVIQRAWRRHLGRKGRRRMIVLAVLARDCALVVKTREKIVGAAVKVQRWWRRVGS